MEGTMGENMTMVSGGLFKLNEWGSIPMSSFRWPAVVGLAAHILYMLIMINVAKARFKNKIWPPKTTGHPDFDRMFRVQANFVEQFPSFALSMVICAVLVNGEVAGLLGAIWVIFRALYSFRYAARRLHFDVYLYTGPQYLVIFLMYLLPVIRILRGI